MAFTKILIANRGEIAVRIARTARAMGYRTVAIYSDADADALHTHICDEAVRVGPAAVRESYLSSDAIIAAAQVARADAVHPGYGFLSENAEFAAACEAAGLVFIGPTPSAIAAMGNKAAAKRLMQSAGVPCVPGYNGHDQSDPVLAREAERIGYPLMIKAAAGGGGRGMRTVRGPAELAAALSSARAEALSAFGADELILERAILDGRHVEIQVFGDSHGNVIHLGERDCSIQRRHQKVIEEAPSPIVSRELRNRMGEAAVTAARAIGYRGAGTVEFLLEQGPGREAGGREAGQFYFLEMNTRLQVEHPVTEAITGLDLVAWQLRVAAGERLPLSQAQVRLEGHAIEARLYAEAPAQGFLPQSGTVLHWEPASGLGIRVDHGLRAPCEITPHYDPMIAKVIARGATREEARRRLLLALEDTVLLGLESNRSFLIDVLMHPEFVLGETTTRFIPIHFPSGSAVLEPEPANKRALALAAALLSTGSLRRAGSADPGASSMPSGWRSTGADSHVVPLKLVVGGTRHDVRVTPKPDGALEVRFESLPHAEQPLRVRLLGDTQETVRYEIDSLRQTARVARAGDVLHLQVAGMTAAITDVTWAAEETSDGQGDARLLAPMNGKIVAVLAQIGDAISKGQRIAVLEAMKMQHDLTAQRDGTLAELPVQVGDQVAARQLVAALSDA